MPKEREETIAHHMRYCQHYDPSGITMIGGKEPHGHCKAGVVYLDQFGRAPIEDTAEHVRAGLGGYYPSAGIFQRICCTSCDTLTAEELRGKCPKCEPTTREQAEAIADEHEAHFQKHMLVMAAVAVWRKKPPRGKAEVIECPACKGRLHLSQAAVNGHVHGHCETEGCVSWME